MEAKAVAEGMAVAMAKVWEVVKEAMVWEVVKEEIVVAAVGVMMVWEN